MAFLVLFEEGPEWAAFLARVRLVREAPPEMPDGELLTIGARACGVQMEYGYLTPDASAVVSSLLGTEGSPLPRSSRGCPAPDQRAGVQRSAG